ncbi:DNA/RNA non-specific endonuclease [Robbsia sp. Bb-Pol-6]|uniref:Endonuclease n=1 Tax=Robbsia betulipollinis TaxID=2981849 RepID=A0ABT3ZNI4_9BURK|nr:DNA/RNA non-specific endonuclease [Robbsia betulipollinis]MCY0388017.1 DNA/RNA non-specific endonuclease [Robbsia betulipollinis]
MHALCFRFYSTAESGVTRTALWSAEKLTRDSVAGAQGETRVNAFHVESAIDAEDRADIADYRGSGYDRGHMAPSGDMPSDDAQYESFSLGNMVPQAPDNNRHLWQGIEIATRAMAKSEGEIYVVTGPLFIGPRALLNARVSVPTQIWKAIYAPQRGAAAYVTANRPGAGYAVISIAELAQITGIDPFPALPASVKQSAMSLPPPRPSGRKLKSGQVPLTDLGIGAQGTGAGLSAEVTAADTTEAGDRSSPETTTRSHTERHRAQEQQEHTAASAPQGVGYILDTVLRALNMILRLVSSVSH